MNRNRRRQSINYTSIAIAYALTGLALIPLGLVLWFTIAKGLPAASHPEFFFNVERPVDVPGAGVAHAIVGTLILVGIASLGAIPIGVLGGIYLAEYATSRWTDWVRLACDVLVGTPSIAIGLFAYALLVAPFHHFSALSGSAALAVLMLPIVMRTTEGAVRLIPGGLRESGLALGLPVARASGETAPLLFTAFGNPFLNTDPTQPMQSLPVTVFHNALLPYQSLQDQAWGAALVLVVMVLLINLTSRYVLRRQIRLAGQL